MTFEHQLRDALERAMVGLRAHLERELASALDEVRRAADAERERAVHEASQAAAAEEQRKADAQIADIREAARRELEDAQRAAAEERERAVREASENAATEERQKADLQIAEIREAARRELEDAQRVAMEERAQAVEQARAAAAADARQQIAAAEETWQRQTDQLRSEATRERDAAASAAAEVARVEARAEADTRIAAAQEAAGQQVEDIKRAAEAQVAELRATLQTQVETIRREAETAAEGARQRAQSDELRRQLEEQLADARRRFETELDEVRTQLRADIESATGEADRARAELVLARTAAEADREAARTAAADMIAARLASASAEAEKKIGAQVADAIRTLDDARSLRETLDALAECAARHVPRAAVLVAKGSRLRGWKFAGFAESDPSIDTELDIETAGVAGAVVKTGVAVSRHDVGANDEAPTRQPALPPFASNAGTRHALALPVVVGGYVVAVLYADAPAETAPDDAAWPAILEVLARHAGRALEAMTVEKVTGFSRPNAAAHRMPQPAAHDAGERVEIDDDAARRYARLLVSEIRMDHETIVNEGRRARDLRSRLGGEIDRARQLYERRVPPTVRERTDYFEQELVRTLADGDRSLLG